MNGSEKAMPACSDKRNQSIEIVANSFFDDKHENVSDMDILASSDKIEGLFLGLLSGADLDIEKLSGEITSVIFHYMRRSKKTRFNREELYLLIEKTLDMCKRRWTKL